jgi:hypothetical protein
MLAPQTFARQQRPVTKDECTRGYIPEPVDVSRPARPRGTRSPQEEHVRELTQAVARGKSGAGGGTGAHGWCNGEPKFMRLTSGPPATGAT